MLIGIQPDPWESLHLPKGGRVSPSDTSDALNVQRLTPGQLECLQLVNQHLSSKALQILGVERRAQAARLVARHGGEYQRLIHQPPHIEPTGDDRHPDEAIRLQIRHADRAGGVLEAGFNTEQRPAARPFLQPPYATRSNPRNEMSVGQRLFWIAAIAIGAAFSAGMYLAGLESLSRLLSH